MVLLPFAYKSVQGSCKLLGAVRRLLLSCSKYSDSGGWVCGCLGRGERVVWLEPAQLMWALCHMGYFAGFTFGHRNSFSISRKLGVFCILLRTSSCHQLWKKYSIEADIVTCGFLRSSFGAHIYPRVFFH